MSCRRCCRPPPSNRPASWRKCWKPHWISLERPQPTTPAHAQTSHAGWWRRPVDIQRHDTRTAKTPVCVDRWWGEPGGRGQSQRPDKRCSQFCAGPLSGLVLVLGFGLVPAEFQLDPAPPALRWSAARSQKHQAGNMHKINYLDLVEGPSKAVELYGKTLKTKVPECVYFPLLHSGNCGAGGRIYSHLCSAAYLLDLCLLASRRSL